MSDSKITETVKNTSRLRNGGENHEWLPVSQAAIAKEWGVTAEQIKELKCYNKVVTGVANKI